MRVFLLLLVGLVLVKPVLGQKLEFDVASVRANRTGFGEGRDPQRVNVPVGPEETWRDTGGVFSAQNVPLVQMISFAYKVTTGQRAVFRASLPEWTQTEGFNIEARTDNHAVTKDQMREMMRNLLADRFKLVAHRETRDVAVYAVEMVTPGVLGPHLRAHAAGEPCSVIAPPLASGIRDPNAAAPPPTVVAGGYPATCGGFARMEPTRPYLRHEGARDMPMATTVTAFSGLGTLGRPAIDKTGLVGNYDWVIEFLQEAEGGEELPADAAGPTFREALKDQLGLKLEAAKAPYEFVVVDHVERPGLN